jgi:anti-sigma B factor antagonist
MSLAELSVTAIDTVPSRLEVAGELDVSTGPVLLARVRDAATTSARVVLELSAVSFMDSRGMLALLESQRVLQARDGQLVLANVSRPVRKVLEITKAWDLFTHEDSSPES